MALVQSAPAVALPPSIAERFGFGELRLRAFGLSTADMAVDFRAPAPYAVTAVLACCARRGDGLPVDEDAIWSLSVGSRTLALAHVMALTIGPEFQAPLRCPACNQAIGIELTIDEIAGAERHDAGAVEVRLGGRSVYVRQPGGSDQAAWHYAGFADEATARRAIVQSLVVEGDAASLDAPDIDAIEAALDDQDPLVRFGVNVVCPDCGASEDVDVPLTEIALARMRNLQTGLIDDVHILATAYGWSEAEVLALPSWRRETYVRLADRERRR